MAERNENKQNNEKSVDKPDIISASDTEAQEAAARKAHAEAEPRGHEQREDARKNHDRLQQQIEQMQKQISLGTIDPASLEIINDIYNMTDYLYVSNRQPGKVYRWESTHGGVYHVEYAKRLGWSVVQGDNEAAFELHGRHRLFAGGSMDTTRQIGDVILMEMSEEAYVVLGALQMQETIAKQRASASGLLDLASQHRDMFKVRAHVMESGGENLSGPDIKPAQFSIQEEINSEQ